MSKRANIFDDATELDVSDFQPETSPAPPPDIETLRKISEASNFPSRQAPKPKSVEQPPASPAPPDIGKPRRQPRTHRTGRNVQFNVKASQETIDAFYRISDEQGWVLGETLERALAALERELADRS